ncbi:MAG: response regulator [Alphaproteobacteria bacterium]|nr:response regulator [Alphaproteobacteria bacterium]MBT4016651.1 response regulator [Alphaproteobacteria bacterium]MBT5161116.1 response regulator [Alphaproteobacteria bacterium]MBT5917929.1 response regulator [Alphaproteobacteria bacterium]MBT6387871.1 response regulator [Alphaproteobacteria bacterium]
MFKLQRYFSIASAIAILTVTVALAFLYRQHAVANLTRLIETQNVVLAQSFANNIWHTYTDYVKEASDLDGEALRRRPETEEINLALHELVHGLPVLKVKMYSLEGNTVYSSEFSQIGESKKGNAGFEATVRTGIPSTKSSFRERFFSFDGGVTNRHLIESYLPIQGMGGAVQGVFELYSDVTPQIDTIRDNTVIVASYLLGSLGLLYAFLFLVVRHAAMIMRAQYVELEHEISERKIAEQKYKDARDDAEQANHAKSDFLAAMSHEIRTPMTGIIGLSELLEDSGLVGKQQDWASSIHRSGQTLLSILNEILDQSKLDAGMFEIDPVNFRLATLINDTTQLFRHRIEQKGLTLEVEMADDLPEYLFADSLRIGQVLSNLLSNALKFTSEGGIVVRIGHQPVVGGDFVLRVSVSDSGAGLLENQKEKLFSAFVQADSSTSRVYGGTGLGLSISRQLVEMMGGRIGVDSVPKEGSMFWFTVNCRLAVPEASDAINKASGNMHGDNNGAIIRSGSWKATRPLRLLVAEDNEINQELIRAMFERLEHLVSTTPNGRRAADLAAVEDFDIVVMDIRMPVMNGMEATKIIRALPGERGKVPVVALTADISVGKTSEFQAAGINGICKKPIELADLLQTINRLLGEEVHQMTEDAPRAPSTETVQPSSDQTAETAAPSDTQSEGRAQWSSPEKVVHLYS